MVGWREAGWLVAENRERGCVLCAHARGSDSKRECVSRIGGERTDGMSVRSFSRRWLSSVGMLMKVEADTHKRCEVKEQHSFWDIKSGGTLCIFEIQNPNFEMRIRWDVP